MQTKSIRKRQCQRKKGREWLGPTPTIPCGTKVKVVYTKKNGKGRKWLGSTPTIPCGTKVKVIYTNATRSEPIQVPRQNTPSTTRMDTLISILEEDMSTDAPTSVIQSPSNVMTSHFEGVSKQIQSTVENQKVVKILTPMITVSKKYLMESLLWENSIHLAGGMTQGKKHVHFGDVHHLGKFVPRSVFKKPISLREVSNNFMMIVCDAHDWLVNGSPPGTIPVPLPADTSDNHDLVILMICSNRHKYPTKASKWDSKFIHATHVFMRDSVSGNGKNTMDLWENTCGLVSHQNTRQRVKFHMVSLCR